MTCCACCALALSWLWLMGGGTPAWLACPPRPACRAQAPLLPGLLAALASKLCAAEDAAMVQSLLCVLAQLMHSDQQQLLDCLAGIQLRWV